MKATDYLIQANKPTENETGDAGLIVSSNTYIGVETRECKFLLQSVVLTPQARVAFLPPSPQGPVMVSLLTRILAK